jgi:hypothetical protein
MSRALPRSDLTGPGLHSTFLLALKNRGLPAPDRERRFALPRKWAFDYCWPDEMVALEVEGGVWTGGRHTRGKGFINDMEKYSEAAIRGWCVLRCTPQSLLTSEMLDMIERAFKRFDSHSSTTPP